MDKKPNLKWTVAALKRAFLTAPLVTRKKEEAKKKQAAARKQ